jgi:hypothetical protein
LLEIAAGALQTISLPEAVFGQSQGEANGEQDDTTPASVLVDAWVRPWSCSVAECSSDNIA